MSGSIFSVNDVSGLPVVDVWSDDRVFMGKYNASDFVISGSRVGVGTNSPRAKLEVSGSSKNILFNLKSPSFCSSLAFSPANRNIFSVIMVNTIL